MLLNLGPFWKLAVRITFEGFVEESSTSPDLFLTPRGGDTPVVPDPILRANTTPFFTPNLQGATVLGKHAGGFTCPDAAEFVGLVTDQSLAGVLPVEWSGATALGGMAGTTVEVTEYLPRGLFWLLDTAVTFEVVCFGGEHAATPELLSLLDDASWTPAVWASMLGARKWCNRSNILLCGTSHI